MKRRTRLTKEQEALRLQGLRLLARMIVRAHLASLREHGGRNCFRPAPCECVCCNEEAKHDG